VWSRPSHILSIRRAGLKADVISYIMYVRKNAGILLQHHYEEIAGENISDAILPTIYDVG
jgi:hypothetical protein